MQRRTIMFCIVISAIFLSLYALARTNIMLEYQHSAILIKPTFTISAYQPNSWYDNKTKSVITYYNEPFTNRMEYGGAYNAFESLKDRVDTVNDRYVSEHPEILNRYNTVILLHNEYMTRQEYNAIMNHTNVFYVFPNAGYRFVTYDINTNQITLLNYTGNKYASSVWTSYESNPTSQPKQVSEFNQCILPFSYTKVNYPNGIGYNCYPEFQITFNAIMRHEILN